MAVMKTPGVYIVEKNAFPNSVVEVATAVPAFIGYTEKAVNGNKSLLNKPWKISSMAEFRNYFGDAPKPQFSISETPPGNGSVIRLDNKDYYVSRQDKFTLYYNILLFYANGGGPCYIVSVGTYEKEVEKETGKTNDDGTPIKEIVKEKVELEKKALEDGLIPLIKEQEPTMVVIPEAVNLSGASDCYSLQQAMLAHCGNERMRNRFAILDVYNGFKDRKDPDGDVVNDFRENIGSNYLDFSAAYYPWLNTSIVQENELDFTNVTGATDLASIDFFKGIFYQEQAVDDASIRDFIKKSGLTLADDIKIEDIEKTLSEDPDEKNKEKNARFLSSPSWKRRKEMDNLFATAEDVSTLHKMLLKSSDFYAEAMKEMRNTLNLLPVSAAMAGIYTMVDNTKGVWKAPANVSLATVISPAVNISHEEQEDLNVPMSGKSVNAIRFFTGEGIKVWGARTLDGNSLDWRYINVRRTMIMLEESVKNASRAYVFDPNEANTWVNVKSMISNFLNGIWKRGGLAGAVPDDAYSVHVGLGETMTPDDILEGIMRITVLVAIVRPAEFIEITFQQQMQKS